MAGEKGKVFAGAAVTAAALAILLANRKVEAQPPHGSTLVTLDDAGMQALLGLLQNSELLDTDIESIVSLLNDLKVGINQLAALLAQLPGGGGTLSNPNGMVAWRTMCPAALTAYQLPSRTIPNDKELAIKALPTNGGVIYVASSIAAATNPNDSYPLIANEAIHYKIHDSGLLWISATVAGEGAVCTAEQEV